MNAIRTNKGDTSRGIAIQKAVGATTVNEGHQHVIVVDDDGRRYATSEQTAKSARAGHSHAVTVSDDGTVTILASDGHTHDAISIAGASELAKSARTTTGAPIVERPPTPEQLEALSKTFDNLRDERETPDVAAKRLDDLTLEYAAKNKVDRPTARVAVCKTVEGRRLYNKSVGRDTPPATVEAAPITKTAREYEAELEALAKSKGMRLADVCKTPEGRALYNAARYAEKAGAR